MKAIIPRQLDEGIKVNLSIAREELGNLLKYTESQGVPKANKAVIRFYSPMLLYLLFGKTGQDIVFSRYVLTGIKNVGGRGPNGKPVVVRNIYQKGGFEEERDRMLADVFHQAEKEKLNTVGVLSTHPEMFRSFPNCFNKSHRKAASGMYRKISEVMTIDNYVYILYFEDKGQYFGMTLDSKPVEIQLR